MNSVKLRSDREVVLLDKYETEHSALSFKLNTLNFFKRNSEFKLSFDETIVDLFNLKDNDSFQLIYERVDDEKAA